MPLSFGQMFDSAVERTRVLCFQNVTFVRWITLSFVAWVSGFATVNFSYQSPSGELPDWLKFNSAAWVAIGAALVVVSIGLVYLSSRMTPVLIDNVGYRRIEIGALWSRYAPQGNSLFVMRMATYLCFAVAGLAAFSALIGVPSIDTFERFVREQQALAHDPSAIFGQIIKVFAVVLPGALLFALAQFFISDIVAPVMVLEGLTGTAALSRGWRLVANAGFVNCALLLAMLVVFAVATAMVSMFLVVATCCIGALPFVSTVVTLPLIVFLRSYSINFVEQMR